MKHNRAFLLALSVCATLGLWFCYYRYFSARLIVARSQSWVWGYDTGLGAGKSDVGRHRHTPGEAELRDAAADFAGRLHPPKAQEFQDGFRYGYLTAYGQRPGK